MQSGLYFNQINAILLQARSSGLQRGFACRSCKGDGCGQQVNTIVEFTL